MGIKRIAMFSGGKDSSALIHWMKDQKLKFDVIFCNTGWELPETISFIKRFAELYIPQGLIEIKSREYDSLIDMVYKKNYMPTVYQRFCTEKLKVQPVKLYIKRFKGEIHLYNGMRKEESLKRRNLKEVVFDPENNVWMHRPLVDWTAAEVMDYLKVKKSIINPLYKKGMKRVGCGPCIMISLKEFASFIKLYPERIKEMIKMEHDTNQFYFPANYIPERFRTGKSTLGNKRATVIDVINYLESKPKYYEISEQAADSCMSYYGLCE